MVRIYTIGHSTRTIEEFLEALKSFGIRMLVDVRSYPGSRRLPHFNREERERTLAADDITCRHHPGLGGFRKEGLGPASPNTALRSEGFRNYADYMLTPEFDAALKELVRWAVEQPTAYMCAEKLFFRCHRQLISDALTAQGLEVVHIMDPGVSRPHQLSEMARVEKGAVTYPLPGEGQMF